MWIEERPLELINKTIGDTDGGNATTGDRAYVTSEILRCIHVALLCVQQRPEDRPKMSSVLLMLGGESTLPQPNQPGYFIEQDRLPSATAADFRYKKQSTSSNEVTITMLDAI